jgi:exosortase A
MTETQALARQCLPVLPALGLALILFAWAFAPEAAAAIQVWRESTAYGHCWLVLPIACWLLWQRRAALTHSLIRPTALPSLAAVPLVLAWLAAYVLGIMELRQLAVIGLVWLLLLSALGWPAWWALSAGFLYLIFLVPFGAFLTPALQAYTAWFVGVGLNALGIPNTVDALLIRIPEGNFYVAEACAGLRFLIASVAFGVLYAVTVFRSPRRRAAFIAIFCAVPVIANGFRGLGIVVLGHELGSAQAAAADHVIYGWLFFSAIILAMGLAGLPFWQEDAAAPPVHTPPPATRARRVLIACVPVVLLAMCAPAAGLWLDKLAGSTAAAPALWVAPPGCMPAAPAFIGPITKQVFACAGDTVRAATVVVPPRSNPSRVVAQARRLAGEGIADPDGSTLTLQTTGWAVLTDSETGHAGAYLLWIDGAPALGGLKDRWRLGWDMLRGTSLAPVIVTASADTQADLRRFLAAQTDLPERLQAASSAAAQK